MGMIEYIEPQCFKDRKYVRREKSDIYSLGVLLWEITSGRPPFFDPESQSINAWLCQYIGEGHREEPIPGTPLEYQKLYQKCWDGDPEKRPDINQVYDKISSISAKYINHNEQHSVTSCDSHIN